MFFQNESQNGKKGASNKLEVVYAGTQEFKIASDMRDLFLEFSDHQERLHKKLALMEGSILATGSFSWTCLTINPLAFTGFVYSFVETVNLTVRT